MKVQKFDLKYSNEAKLVHRRISRDPNATPKKII